MALRAGSVGLGCEAGLGLAAAGGAASVASHRPPLSGSVREGSVRGGSLPPRRVAPRALARRGCRGGPPRAVPYRAWKAGVGALGSGGGRRRLWTCVGPFSRISSATVTVAAPPGVAAVRLGWHLAADLELVRTRGIRLFN